MGMKCYHQDKMLSSLELAGLPCHSRYSSVNGLSPAILFPPKAVTDIHPHTHFILLLIHPLLNGSGLILLLDTLPLIQKARISLIHLDFGPPNVWIRPGWPWEAWLSHDWVG